MKIEIEISDEIGNCEMLDKAEEIGFKKQFLQACFGVGLLIANRAESFDEAERIFRMILKDEVDFEKPTKKPNPDKTLSGKDWGLENPAHWSPGKRRSTGM